MKKPLLIVISIFIFLLASYFKLSNKKNIYVGKSSWPSWDLFEKSQQSTYLFSKYKLRFIHYNNYQGIINAFINKDIDIATTTLLEALLINNHTNNGIQIILLLDYTTGSDAVLAQNTIEYIDDLTNKTVGVEKNTVSYYTLLRSLEKANLTKDMVKIKNLNSNELITQFKQKKLDAISLYDPYIFELNEYKDNLNIIFSSKEIPREICDVIIIRKSILEQYPSIVNKIKTNWFKATEHQLKLDKLDDPIYKNKDYIKHIKQNIYFANKNENKFAFGTKGNPGYLFDTIQKITVFLNNETDIQVLQKDIQDILYITK